MSPFREIFEAAPAPNAYSQLQDLDQEKTCHIAEAADLCLMLTKGLDRFDVYKQLGVASEVSWSDVSISP